MKNEVIIYFSLFSRKYFWFQAVFDIFYNQMTYGITTLQKHASRLELVSNLKLETVLPTFEFCVDTSWPLLVNSALSWCQHFEAKV